MRGGALKILAALDIITVEPTSLYASRLLWRILLPCFSFRLEQDIHIDKMPPKSALADAWDDDWESLADVHVPLFLAFIRSQLVERRREASRRAAEAETHQGATKGSAC